MPEGVAPPGTRGRILRAALKLFAEYGYYGASIRDIAAAVGINSATLYAHYPSKEQLLADLIVVGHEELHRRLLRALVESGSDPVEQLAALVRAQVLAHADFPLLAVVSNQELHALSPQAAAPALALREHSAELLLRVLDLGAQRGIFAVPDVRLAATAIGSIGIRVANWFHSGGAYSRERVADTFAEFALRIAGAAALPGDAGTTGPPPVAGQSIG
nr:TetR/AcrR family transcriptional regulator [Planosporangium thailandense]